MPHVEKNTDISPIFLLLLIAPEKINDNLRSKKGLARSQPSECRQSYFTRRELEGEAPRTGITQAEFTSAAVQKWRFLGAESPCTRKSPFYPSAIKIYGNAINFTEWRLCRHSAPAKGGHRLSLCPPFWTCDQLSLFLPLKIYRIWAYSSSSIRMWKFSSSGSIHFCSFP